MTPKKLLIILLSGTGGLALLFAAIVYFTVSGNLPSLEQLENPPQNKASQILSEDGEIIDHFFIERRVNVPYSQIPKNFINALITTEDRKFESHWGVDIDRILKATIKNILAGHAKEGASTITQQLARNLFLDQTQTFSRKIKEAATAIQIEDTYTKEEIIEMYANTVAFGRGAYGIQVAARQYFNKKPSELSLSECAYLVGLLKAPARYDAKNNYDRAINRRNLILGMMRDAEVITESEYFEATEQAIKVSQGKKVKRELDIAPQFVESIRQNLNNESKLEEFDIYRDGLIINTTLNATVQRYANEAVEQHLKEFQNTFNKSFKWGSNQKLLASVISDAIRKNPEYRAASKDRKEEVERRLRANPKFIDSAKNTASTIQVGLVVLDPKTGAILAMVGSSPKFIDETNEYKYSLNHANQIHRQPGSAFKPFVYALALKNGLNPQSMVDCGPYSYRDPGSGAVWSPSVTDSDCLSAGSMVTLAEALRKSVNSVAARLVTQNTTASEVKALIEEAGVKSKLSAVPAIALGAGGEVSPLELTAAYTIFANQGRYVEPYYVNSIEDKSGNVIFERKNKVMNDVIDEGLAQQMTAMMRGVVDAGTAGRIRQIFRGVEAAGKTGTTNDNADAWFIGYTPELLCGVWVGFDDQRINFDIIGKYGQGGRAAAPIWALMMNKIYNDPNLPYKKRSFGFQEIDSLGAPVIKPQAELNPNNNTNSQASNLPNKKKTNTDNQTPKAAIPQGNSVLPKLPKRQ